MYQFISFAGANFHGNAQAYTDKQDTILAFLNTLNLEDKQYILPRPAENATPEDQQKFAVESQGKPWAMVNYHSGKDTGMIMPMIRGLIIDILAIFLLFGLLDKVADINTMKAMIYACTVGFLPFWWYPTPTTFGTKPQIFGRTYWMHLFLTPLLGPCMPNFGAALHRQVFIVLIWK